MGSIGAVVLAAGSSSRLGEPKQLLALANGETLVHAAVRAAYEGGCDTVCVVTGEHHESVRTALADCAPVIVYNENWARGIGTSIRCGVAQFSAASAIVLLACDQPALTGDIVRALIETHRQTGRPIVASRYAGTLGIPALFGRICFAELEALPDDCGAKKLIAAGAIDVAVVEFSGGAMDIDTPGDWREWREMKHGYKL
jgi:molybdenum cofactor cytidylyltransferase